MSIFDGSKFGTFDVRDLKNKNDSEMVLSDIVLGESENGGEYFELQFVGAFSDAFTTSPRFWEARSQDSKVGRLLLSLEDNLDMTPVPESMEALIGHRLMVRRNKELNYQNKETEYFEIIEDLGESEAHMRESNSGVDTTGVTYSDLADLIHGKTREEAVVVLLADTRVQGAGSMLSDVEDGAIFDILEENGFVSVQGDLFRKDN